MWSWSGQGGGADLAERVGGGASGLGDGPATGMVMAGFTLATAVTMDTLTGPPPVVCRKEREMCNWTVTLVLVHTFGR